MPAAKGRLIKKFLLDENTGRGVPSLKKGLQWLLVDRKKEKSY